MEDRTIEVEQYEIIQAISDEQMQKVEREVDSFLSTLDEAGKLRNGDDFDTLASMQLSVPRELHTLSRRHYHASKRLNAMKMRIDKMEVVLTRTIKTRYNEVMDGKIQKKAFLTVDHFETAIAEYNRQKEFIDYIAQVVDQYRYLNNSINSRIELAKFMREQGY